MSLASVKAFLARERQQSAAQGESGEKGDLHGVDFASPFSAFSLGQGESGRIGENQNAILPRITVHAAEPCSSTGRIGRKSLRLTSCAGAGEIAPAAGTSLFPRFSLPAPQATILKHCRCMDCRHWDHVGGMCHEVRLTRYIPREHYHPLMRRGWSDDGMIRVDQWHYCAFYHGPQISKDIWVWPRQSGAVCVAASPVNGGSQ